MAFKDEVKLDINHLDRNAIDQVSLYEEHSRLWADAVAERDRAKERLSIVRAETDELIRKAPKKYGWSNPDKAPTEAWYTAQITLHPDMIKANNELLDAQNEVNIRAVAKETLEHRKSMLSVLTELYKGQYFCARSRTDPNYKEAVSEEGRTAQQEALENSSRSRRKRGE